MCTDLTLTLLISYETFLHWIYLLLARAEAYKEDGNIQYKKRQFKTAIKNYTEGIKIKCEDSKLNAILYTNRATSHSYLGKQEMGSSLKTNMI